MKKLVSLIVIATWIVGTLGVCASYSCEGMSCCATQPSSLSKVSCHASCEDMYKAQSASQGFVLESFKQGGNFTLLSIIPQRKEESLSHQLFLANNDQLEILDRGSTYLQLLQFRI